MEDSFYSRNEIKNLGFKIVGENVLISRKASIYKPSEITVGSNVRIDDFCILSGRINIGSFIHISAYSALYARFGIVLEDFVTISGKTLIYSQTDDYSGEFMTNPTLPDHLTNVTGGEVNVKKFAIVAAGCVIFPGVTIHEGAVVGAMSLVNKDLEAWKIYAGIPAKLIKDRKKDILKIYKNLTH